MFLSNVRSLRLRVVPCVPSAVLASLLTGTTLAHAESSPQEAADAVGAVLDDFHDASWNADAERFFGHLTPDAILFGTAGNERFTVEQFREFTREYYEAGVKRVSKIVERHVTLSASGKVAWFDEYQERPELGLLRGSGVLVKERDAWKVAQYHLAFPVPNQLVPDLTEMVRARPAETARTDSGPKPAADRGQDARQAVKAVLTDFHRAAAEADGARYFGHLAADGIFVGTAREERWDLAGMKAFAGPYFDRGTGWTSVPTEQHVFLSADGRTAWFDESLENQTFCATRSTGVLRLVDDQWKIVHYNLVFPVPNELALQLVEMKHELAVRK